MHLVRALVFLVDPLEHFISVASARDELIFYFGLPGRLFWWFVVEGSSDFFKVAMAPATAMKATTLTASNVFLVATVTSDSPT